MLDVRACVRACMYMYALQREDGKMLLVLVGWACADNKQKEIK